MPATNQSERQNADTRTWTEIAGSVAVVGGAAALAGGAVYASYATGVTPVVWSIAKFLPVPMAVTMLTPTFYLIPAQASEPAEWALPILATKAVIFGATAYTHAQWGWLGTLPLVASFFIPEVGPAYEYKLEDGKACEGFRSCVSHAVNPYLLTVLAAEGAAIGYKMGVVSALYTMAGTLFLSRAVKAYYELPSDNIYKETAFQLAEKITQISWLKEPSALGQDYVLPPLKAGVHSIMDMANKFIHHGPVHAVLEPLGLDAWLHKDPADPRSAAVHAPFLPVSMTAVGIGITAVTALAMTSIVASAVVHYGGVAATMMMASPILMGEVPEELHGLMVVAWLPSIVVGISGLIAAGSTMLDIESTTLATAVTALASVGCIAKWGIPSELQAFAAAAALGTAGVLVTGALGGTMPFGITLSVAELPLWAAMPIAEAAMSYMLGAGLATTAKIIGLSELALLATAYYQLPAEHTLKTPLTWAYDAKDWVIEHLPSFSHQQHMVEHDIV